MRKLLVFFSMVVVAGMMTVNLTSCSEDAMPEPTVKILVEVDPADQYTVNISVQATDATSYAWNYGDGETSDKMGGHAYTYGGSGTYTISVIVTNESGTATASEPVVINASFLEMIAGVDNNGKTWKLSADHLVAISAINPDFDPLYNGMALQQNALNALGLGAEYDNEFTFYRNGDTEGAMGIDGKNGAILTAAVFGLSNGIEDVNSWSMDQIIGAGMYAGAYTATTNGTWEITEDTDLTVSCTGNEFAVSDGDELFAGADYLTFGNGAFLGIRDFYPIVLIRNISAEKIDVVIFLSTSQETPQNPSLAIKASFVAQ